MELTDFTIRIIIILIPGAIAALIVETITIHKKWSHTRFVITSVILGACSFCTLQLFYWVGQSISALCIPNYHFKTLETWQSIFDKNIPLNPLEIIICFFPTSVIVGYLVGLLIQKRVVKRFARKLKISTKYGDDSLYYYFLENDLVDWVYIRDKVNGLTYRGQVERFAEDETNKEIVLRRVTVYQYENSAELYSLLWVYLKFNARDISIEVPRPS